MIIGIGTDIVRIERIRAIFEKYDQRFVDKYFTDAEKEQALKRHDCVRYYAKRFAAKEALLKAMGTGMRDNLSWKDMSITNDPLGAPVVTVSGAIEKALKEKQGINDQNPVISISLSDEDAYALAFVIVEIK